MRLFNKVLTIAGGLAALAFAVSVSAAPVVCGNIVLGTRTVTIDPGLVGGFCHGQIGNLQNADITTLGLGSLDKDEVGNGPGQFPNGDNSEGALQFSQTTSTSGTWTFDQSLWNTWDRLFLGFHFGGGGDNADDNPDSFVVEISPFDFTGTFALGGGQLNGLSNIHLLGVECRVPGCNGQLIPEPATLLLISLGFLGLAVRPRRWKQ